MPYDLQPQYNKIEAIKQYENQNNDFEKTHVYEKTIQNYFFSAIVPTTLLYWTSAPTLLKGPCPGKIVTSR